MSTRKQKRRDLSRLFCFRDGSPRAGARGYQYFALPEFIIFLKMVFMSETQQTPMMQQYWDFKKSLPKDCLLLFRLGDFFEMFHEDAHEGARLLGITLTKRQNYPMAGIPHHALESYLPKLLAVGKKVAICEQTEAPVVGKLVRRAVTRILTPGTTIDDRQLDAGRNHYLLALNFDKHGLHAAWLDLSTGDFAVASEEDFEALLPVLSALDAKEILVPEDDAKAWTHFDGTIPPEISENCKHWAEAFSHLCQGKPVTGMPDYFFDPAAGRTQTEEALHVANLEGFGVTAGHRGLGPAGAVLAYASESLRQMPQNLRGLRPYRAQASLLLDPATLRSLEIFESARGGDEATLRNAIDRTVSAAGARLLERWLAAPLLELGELQRRQTLVGELMKAGAVAGELQGSLKKVRDIERILARLQNRVRNPRELGGIRETLSAMPEICELLESFDSLDMPALRKRVHPLPHLRKVLTEALADDPPSDIREGGVFREGYDHRLDQTRALSRDHKGWLSGLERAEQERTGIRSLKIRYNAAVGYFIEITKANLASVPPDYIRRQTMTNAERFITEDLRKKEKEILHAEERALAIEEELFQTLIASVLEQAAALRETATALAELDVLVGWAFLAREWDYCRPSLDESDQCHIEQGRHPVVEQMLRGGRLGSGSAQGFVPNDTDLSCSHKQIALITGPNMAGKSTYIRQVALIVLMAQIGCWVPAKSAKIGIVDRIFSRVGASDELVRGNSTFMVEMNETANILNNATDRSLIILDEIGRGTSTYDGLSIAWAVAENLHGSGEGGPRTLFATHYHELTQLSKTLPRLHNYAVAVREWNDRIVFVRQVVEGAADRSYGIHVAQLAGLPSEVITRAKEVLDLLEKEGNALQSNLRETLAKAGRPQRSRRAKTQDIKNQLSFF